jgi:hypothetical protein
MKAARIAILGLVLWSLAGGTAAGACGQIDSDLSIRLSCVELFNGARFRLVLDFYANPLDPSGFYWKFNAVDLTPTGGECAYINRNLSIIAPCLEAGGASFRISLDFYANPNDPAGLYWKFATLARAAPAGLTIDYISGDDSNCLDPDAYVNCVINCGADAACVLNCFPQQGFATLEVKVSNTNPFEVVFDVWPGSVFEPEMEGVQTMMSLIGITSRIPPAEIPPDGPITPGTATFCVPVYCLDALLSAPGTEDGFRLGGVVNTPCLLEIIALAEGKKLSIESTMQIQNIVWNCLETGAITSDERDYLQKL